MLLQSQNKNNTPGFTLIELMVCIAIVAMAFSSILIARNNCVDQAEAIVNMRLTSTLAEQKLNELVTLSTEPDVGTQSGTFEDYPEFGWSSEVSLNEIETEKTSPSSSSDISSESDELTEAFKITVNVFPVNSENDNNTSANNPNSSKLVLYVLKEEDRYVDKTDDPESSEENTNDAPPQDNQPPPPETENPNDNKENN